MISVRQDSRIALSLNQRQNIYLIYKKKHTERSIIEQNCRGCSWVQAIPLISTTSTIHTHFDCARSCLVSPSRGCSINDPVIKACTRVHCRSYQPFLEVIILDPLYTIYTKYSIQTTYCIYLYTVYTQYSIQTTYCIYLYTV